jgi:RNA polymerase primary sigma factor
MSSPESLAWMMDSYARAPLLSKRAVIELFRQYELGRADDATPRQKRTAARAKQRILTSNLRLAVSVALKRRIKAERVGMGLEDLIQEAIIGLNRAVELYDYRKGYQFSTYAHWWCLQAVGRALDVCGLIHIPTGPAALLNKLRYAPAELVNTRQKAQDYLGISASQMESLERAMLARSLCSLDNGVYRGDGTDSSSLADLLPDPRSAPDLDQLDRELALEAIEDVLDPTTLQTLMRHHVQGERLGPLADEQGLTRPELVRELDDARERAAAHLRDLYGLAA